MPPLLFHFGVIYHLLGCTEGLKEAVRLACNMGAPKADDVYDIQADLEEDDRYTPCIEPSQPERPSKWVVCFALFIDQEWRCS